MADVHELGVRYRAEGQEQVKQANRDVASTGKQAEQATKDLEAAQERRSKADKEAATTAATVTRATTEAMHAAVTSTRATQGQRQQVEQTTRAMVMMTNEVRDAAAAQKVLQSNTVNATRAMSGFDMRGPLLQMSQIVQQTAATGQLMQAVSIQAADIGMYFGAVGTAVGMAATVLIPYVASLWDTEAATRAAKDAQEEWQESLANAESHIANAESALRMLGDSGLDALTEKYGEATEAVRELIREFAALEEEAAAREIASLIGDNLVGQIAADMEASAGAVAGVMLQPMEELAAQAEVMRQQIADERAALQAMQAGTLPFDQQSRLISEMEQELAALEGRYQDMGALTEQLGPDASQVERIRDMMEALDAATARQDFEAVAYLISEIRSTADQAGIELDTGMRQTLAEIEDIARQFVGRLGDAKDEADGFIRTGLPSFMGDAADYALNFANDMARAFGFADRISRIDLSGAFGSMGSMFPGLGVAWDRSQRIAGAAGSGILDLIAAAEGTDFRPGADGYNETLDFGRWTGGNVDLVNMTLREVRALQDTMRTPENRALYGDGAGSSAVGRYQIVSSTLDDLMGWLGLSGNEKFSPEMQDRMAFELIRRQGADAGTWAGLSDVPQSVITTAMGQQSIPSVDPEFERDRTRATREATQAERARARELERTETAYDRVRAALDPLNALEMEYEKAKEAVQDARKAGLISLAEEEALLSELSAKYQQDLDDLSEEMDAERLEAVRQGWEGLTQTLLRAAQAGESIGDALRSWLADAVLQAAARDLVNTLSSVGGGGGIFGSIAGWLFGGANANGNAFSGGSVIPFASGGVVNGPTYFGMSGGRTGLMGEAGPEAIMPLTRGADGKLGVQAQGGGVTSVSPVFHIDARGAQRGVAEEIAQQLGRVYPQIMQDAVSAVRKENSERRFE